MANGIKSQLSDMMAFGKFVPLRTSSPSVFAYALSHNGKSLVTIGNLDFRNNIDVQISVPKLTEETMVLPLKIKSMPIAQKGKFSETIEAGEIQVLLLDGLEVK